MAKVFQWQAGSLQDKVSGNFLTDSGVVFKQTEKGDAGYFNGSSTYLDTGSVNFGTVHSLSAYIKSINGGIIFGGTVPVSFMTFYLTSVQYKTSGTNYVSVTLDIKNDGKFHHVMTVRNGLTVSFYSDGVLVGSGTLASNDDLIVDTIGGFNPAYTGYRFKGYIVEMSVFNTALTSSEIASEYNEFLHSFPKALSKFNFVNAPNYSDGDVTFFDDFRYEYADGVSRIPRDWIKGTGTFKFSELTSDIPLLNLAKGHKMLECTASGTLAFQSSQAYGTWEFKIKAAETIIGFISEYKNLLNGTYVLGINSAMDLYLQNTTYLTKLFTKVSYLTAGKYYQFKITRSLSGEFSVYIKTESNSNYELVFIDVFAGDSGSNPVTDNNHTTSKLTVFNSGLNFGITEIKYTKGIVS